jgi:cytochrome b pre-mRNA-processing protein 3
MKSNYLNIYNKFIILTRNKKLYQNYLNQDTFSDRLIYFLLHFAFFLKVFKSSSEKSILQDIYDFIFRQIELSIREIGYGDQSINKKMKDYLNLLYSMIDKIHNWETLSYSSKRSILINYVDKNANFEYLVEYFEKYLQTISNKTLNSYIKSVDKH